MAKTRTRVSARASQAKGRRRKKPANRVERAFDEIRQVVSETGDRLLSRSGQRKAAAAKKAGAARIRRGQQRQAEVKKAARKRRVRTS